MALPVKTAVREDALSLHRALHSLEEVRKSLKEFSRTASVKDDPSLAGAVDAMRLRVKKARKLGMSLAETWTRKQS
jgi:hypothetical protein